MRNKEGTRGERRIERRERVKKRKGGIEGVGVE